MSSVSEIIVPVLSFVLIFMAFFVGVFLYWREGKHELVENKILFDIVAAFLLGAAIFGRIIDFVVRVDFYGWSFSKLLFFNAYWGFDIYGAIVGGIFFAWFYIKSRKGDFWEIFDFASTGMAAVAWLYFFGKSILTFAFGGIFDYQKLTTGLGYFLLFWLLKRLQKQKKHKGFFANFFLTGAAVINLLVLVIYSGINLKENWWQLGLNSIVFLGAVISWYLLSKRKIFSDLKSIFGLLLLSLFKTKRVFTNLREADNSAKALVLSPLYVAKGIYNLVKYLGREIYLSIIDLARAFRVHK